MFNANKYVKENMAYENSEILGHTLATVIEADDMDVAKHVTLPWLCTLLMVFEKETTGLTHTAEPKPAGK